MGDGSDGAHDLFFNRVTPFDRPGQEENRLLDIRSQVEQVHDLGDACACHIAESGQISVVLVSIT